jgi:hypothetical protein
MSGQGNGTIATAGPAVIVNTEATREFRDFVKARAQTEGKSPSELIREALSAYLAGVPQDDQRDEICLINVKVPPAMRAALKARAEAEGISLSQLMRSALSDHLREPYEPDGKREEVNVAA